ncbi:MAG: response regulator transcription factor [candidate division Zixibacteria bacterium]|nr:response regulator transcription factor [candidate division Zixibacteria bacterium]
MIADERKLFRQGLIALFATESGILVAGETTDGLTAVELAESKKPDVVVLNVNLPGLDGINAGRKIRRSASSPELVFLSTRHNEAQMREAFRVGGKAWLLQDCDFRELVFAIRKAAVGDYYLSGPAGYEMVQGYVNPGDNIEDTEGIMTRRETELARLLAEGYSTKEAAARLNISVKTAETHRAAVMKKLRAKNVTDIVKYCIRNKLIEP